MSMNKYAKMELKRGYVVWVLHNDCEAEGCEMKKTRPYVIVSNDYANNYSPIVIAVPLTSARKQDLPTHSRVTLASKKNNTALCEQVTTIDVTRIVEYIDYVRPKEMTAIDLALKVAMGLLRGE